MGLKEKMAEGWMGKMDPKEKREMMEAMMSKGICSFTPRKVHFH